MTEYQLHWWPPGAERAQTQRVELQAESHFHGAALALRHFMQLGCVVTTPLAHLDVTEPDDTKQTLLIEEVLDWLTDPKQAGFRDREGLDVLFD